MATPPRNDSKEDPSPEKSQTQTPPSLALSLALLPSPSSSSKHNPHVPFASSSSSSRSPAAGNYLSFSTPIVLPPGFMFVPSDEILIFHYLRPFLHHNKKSSPNVPIHRVNIYDSNPEQLSSLSPPIRIRFFFSLSF